MISSCRMTASCQWEVESKDVAPDGDVVLDFFDSVEDMTEIKPIALHRLTASFRTCSRM